MHFKLEKFSDRQIALAIFSAAFLSRAIYAIYCYMTQPIPETNLYYELAIDILRQGKVFYDTGHPYYEFPGPVLPWLNALTMLLFGKNYLGLYLVTAAGSSLITYYTYKVSRLFLDKAPAFLIGAYSTIYLFYFYYVPSPGKDIWMAFFMIFLIYCFIRLFIRDDFSYTRFLVFTVMFVIAFHLDERFFVFTPFIGLYILYKETAFFSRFAVRKTLLFTVLILLLMVPWTVRNYEKHGKIVILSTRTEAFTDPIMEYESRGHMMDEYNDTYGTFYIRDEQIDSVTNGLITRTDGGWIISKEQKEAMKGGLLPGPIVGIKAFTSRIVTMFEPLQLRARFERTGYYFYKKSPKHNIATFLCYGIFFIFSFPGFYKLYKMDRAVFCLFLLIILIYGLIHAVAIPYTNWRYRLPLDSIFIITGWIGIMNIFSYLKKRFKTPLPDARL